MQKKVTITIRVLNQAFKPNIMILFLLFSSTKSLKNLKVNSYFFIALNSTIPLIASPMHPVIGDLLILYSLTTSLLAAMYRFRYMKLNIRNIEDGNKSKNDFDTKTIDTISDMLNPNIM